MGEKSCCSNCRFFLGCPIFLAVPSDIDLSGADLWSGADLCCPLWKPRPEVEKP